MESEIKLAVLSNEVENVKKEVKDTKDIAIRIEGKMDSQAALFASKEDLNTVNSRIDQEVLPAVKEIKDKKMLRENVLIITIICQFILIIIGVYTIFKG